MRDKQIDEHVTLALESANASARHFRTVYSFYLFFALFFLINVLITDQELLFREGYIQMPIVNVSVPVVRFFIVSPLVLLILHFNLLIQALFLSKKIALYSLELSRCGGSEISNREALDSLFPMPLVYLIANSYKKKSIKLLLGTVVFISIAIVPITILIFAQVRFLPYQSEIFTWIHRITVLVDIGMLCWIWPHVTLPNESWLDGYREIDYRHLFLAIMLLPVIVTFIFCITDGAISRLLPEALDQNVSMFSKRNFDLSSKALVSEEPAPVLLSAFYSAECTSENSEDCNSLGIKPGSEFWCAQTKPLILNKRILKRASLSDTILCAVEFEYADLSNANLSKAILIGANFNEVDLSNANLSKADLTGANFSEVDLAETNLIGANLTRADLSKADLTGAFLFEVNLTGANLAEANLSGMDLAMTDLTEAILIGANFNEVDLSNVNLSKADLTGANFSEVDLAETNLIGANLTRANLARAILKYAELPGADLREANLTEAILTYADLSEADLREANLTEAILTYADLSNANLFRVNLTEAILKSADLSNANLFRVVLSGLDLSHVNLSEANLFEADLSGAILTYADLIGADLSNAKLFEADLKYADLSNANLFEADLSGAILTYADLIGADLSNAKLFEADLKYADLIGADLSNANLFEADLEYADLTYADLSNADLSGVDLTYADLSGANLSGADLTGAELLSTNGVTQSQLNQACGNHNTKLTEGLRIIPCD